MKNEILKYEELFKLHLTGIRELVQKCPLEIPNFNDRAIELFDNGYTLAYYLGVSEVFKPIIFTEEKINKLKKLGEKKSREEYFKINNKLETSIKKILLQESKLVELAGKKSLEENIKLFRKYEDVFFYATNEKKNFELISDKFKNKSYKDMKKYYLKSIEPIKKSFKKRFSKPKNPYDMFVQPYEQSIVLATGGEWEKIFDERVPHYILGWSHGIADAKSFTSKVKIPIFYYLSYLTGKKVYLDF